MLPLSARCFFHAALVCSVALSALSARVSAASVSLFDGATLKGWDGETSKAWRVRDGVIVGGSHEGNPRNEFLATAKSYRNFVLKLEYKLEGSEGFVNGGVQFRSKRIPEPPNEMSGYQADIGAGYSGFLYDESRRKKFLVSADKALVEKLEKKGDWNAYEIRVRGRRIELVLNGQTTVNYTETEAGIEEDGLIALQIHGNCKAEISFRNITIDVLPNALPPEEAEILGRFGSGQAAPPPPPFVEGRFQPNPGEVIVFAGQENLVREQRAGELETLLSAGFAQQAPRFRSMAWEADTVYEQWRDLNFGLWFKQLETAGASAVIAQFGQMEALDGVGSLKEFVLAYDKLLDQFASRTRRLVLLSPMPFEKPMALNAPDLTQRNADVAAYVGAVREIATQRGAVFVDIFTELSRREPGMPRLTEDGIHLTASGLREVAELVARKLGTETVWSESYLPLRAAIVEKNRLWFDCWRPANWSFVYGDRVSQPYGKGGGGVPSLQSVFEGQKGFLAQADEQIHALARGEEPKPKQVPAPGAASAGSASGTATGTAVVPKALTPEEQLATFTVAEGYEVTLFASERDGVVKPTQIAWDEKGRLFVACSPTYPQTHGVAKPGDYLLMLEDPSGSGRATKSGRFAEGLTMVQGVEPGEGGVFVCDFDQLVHLRDTDGDGMADSRRVVLSGFGIGDTHQLVNSISHGPDGSLWFTQGLHAFSRVESPWGVARLDRAGVWRLNPRTMRLEGFFGGGMAGVNCWGVAFDDYGQVFHKSGAQPQGYWTVPGMVRGANPKGSSSHLSADSAYAPSSEQYHSVGALFQTSPKTTSLEIIGTRALPEEIQGCALIAGYFGAVVELHTFGDEGAGFKSTQLPKLLRSSDPSFRPVDVSVGPDGAMYVADWFNPIIGHYQASYADPKRDKTHGRIWRISAKGRAPVKQPDLAAMGPAQLLEQLRSPERWTRYHAKRLLGDLPDAAVLAAADAWLAGLNTAAPDYEKLLLEVTGVFEAHEAPRPGVLAQLAAAKDPRVRAYGARVAGMWATRVPAAAALLRERVRDENARVRLEAVVAASYLEKAEALEIVTTALEHPTDRFLDYAIRASARALQPHWGPVFEAGKLRLGSAVQEGYVKTLATAPKPVVPPGLHLYEMACLACHQPEGKGLPGVYPPLAGSDWLKGDPERLIKVILHGLAGPVTVSGQTYGRGENAVPMPGMAGLTDQQIVDVLGYVRSEFGEKGAAPSLEQVKRVRAATGGRDKAWTAAELGF